MEALVHYEDEDIGKGQQGVRDPPHRKMVIVETMEAILTDHYRHRILLLL
jgi:hypothetical protein